MLLAEAAMKIDTAYLHAFRAADDLDRGAPSGRHPDLDGAARVRDRHRAGRRKTAARRSRCSCRRTAPRAWPTANRMQRLWRDVHVASHHAITEWQVNLEVYGKALLGVEPNITPLI